MKARCLPAFATLQRTEAAAVAAVAATAVAVAVAVESVTPKSISKQRAANGDEKSIAAGQRHEAFMRNASCLVFG